MKVLQINTFYKFGSTGKIVFDIHEELKRTGNESIVCYGRRKKTNEPGVFKVSSEIEGKIGAVLTRLFSVNFGYSYFSTAKVIRIIKKEKPDVVHLHCLNGHFVNVYRLVEYLKKNNIRTVLTLHAEIMHTAGCDHALDCNKWQTECHSCVKVKGKISGLFRDDAKVCFNKMKKAFAGFENLTVVGVSEWLTKRAKSSPIFDDCKFDTIHNGIMTDVFTRHESYELRQKLGIPDDKKVILHVTPDFKSKIKGGSYVLQLAEKLPEYQFIIVGYNDTQSDDIPRNIITVSHTQDQIELAKYYSMADCFICTSLRESLPTVCLEAISCGTKVVAFNSGGIPETIPEWAGETVECYDIDKFATAVQKWVDITVPDEMVLDIGRINSRKNMFNEYLKIYNNEVVI